MKTTTRLLLVAALASVSSLTLAHVTLADKEAENGSYHRFTLNVPHGCKGAPTTAITVHIPEGIQGAKPLNVQDWDISTEKSKLKHPYTAHGKEHTEDVSAITWANGDLPNDFYGEFVFRAKVSTDADTLLLKIDQQCGDQTVSWSAESHDEPHPAAVLTISHDQHSDDHHGHNHSEHKH